MKKTIIVLIIGLLITGMNAYAADGDFIVDGKVGVGTETPAGKMEIVSDNEGALQVTTTSDTGSSSAALEVNATDSVVGIKKGLAGLLVNYRHDGGSNNDLTVNHMASRVAMNLAGSGSSGYDVGHVAHSASLTFKAQDDTPGYNYYQQNAYAFAMRAGVISHGQGTKKHYIKNVGGLQVLHHYDNSYKTLSAENLYGIIVGDLSQYSTNGLDSVANAGGILINKQTDYYGDRISNLMGLWMNGDGAGADIVLGSGKETRLYGYGGDFIIDTTGNVGIGTADTGIYTLAVAGDLSVSGCDGCSNPTSDIKFKDNIEPIESSLDKIRKIQGVSFNWKTKEFKERKFPGGKHYGVVAQEIEKVLPEVVVDGSHGEKRVAYLEMIPILIEAVKEQQKIIEKQNKDMEELKAKVQKLEAKGYMAEALR
jgi:hypothetical protein